MLLSQQHALDVITQPALDPLFYLPSRAGVPSAWYGHLPFGYWLVGQARPRIVVELGTHHGVSYSAFCDAVLDQRLTTRCFAIDTWKGDQHAGLYDEEVFQEFQKFHDLRYAAFSTLLCTTFDEAVSEMPDGGIDVLHIDGEHTYEAVRHDFESWLPKLSDQAVVLFHDTNVHEHEFGVWRLWDELRQVYPNFEFLHSSGLGMLAVGQRMPSCVAALCGLTDDAAIATVRERFARLGERCEFQYVASQIEVDRERLAAAEREAQRVWTDATIAWNAMDRDLKATKEDLAQARFDRDDALNTSYEAKNGYSEIVRQLSETKLRFTVMVRERDAARNALSKAEEAWAAAEQNRPASERELHSRLVEAEQALAVAVQELSMAKAALDAEAAARHELELQWGAARAYIEQLRTTGAPNSINGENAEDQLQSLRDEVDRLSRERELIVNSTIWRATAPLRLSGRYVPRPARRALRRLLQTMRGTVKRPTPRPTAVPNDAPAIEDPPASPEPLPSAVIQVPVATEPASAETPTAIDAHAPVEEIPPVPEPVVDSPAPIASGPMLAELVAALDAPAPVEETQPDPEPPTAIECIEIPATTAADDMPILVADDPVSAATRKPHIVFISGEVAITGHSFRVLRPMRVAESLGFTTSWVDVWDVPKHLDEIVHASVVFIWRTLYSEIVTDMIATARANGAKVVFDVDDLMFKPELAVASIIDGIRTQGLTEESVAMYYLSVRDVSLQADACSCTTEELARHFRDFDKAAFVLPNCFDTATLHASRLAVRRRVPANDGIVRIGYATGSRTHQHDFRSAAEALGRILRERPECRLVLFRRPEDGVEQLDPSEFPTLAGLESQIEWRDLVPLAELPNELARFDINLAPLEVGNPFCEAKSELKYFEAALVEVCTIASPTGPMRRAIRDGITGRLADTPDEWYAILNELIADRQLRQRLAHAAYLDVLAQFGPERSAEALRSMLQQVCGGSEAIRAFELDLLRKQRPPISMQFDIPESEVRFAADSLGTAEVTVIIPLYNYAIFIEEALDSVLNQTLQLIDLVVVDDASTDNSLQIALAWVQRHATRFNRVLVVRNRANSGLARSRNVGFDLAETAYVMPLDADNRLLPECCARLLQAAQDSHAAFAYSKLQGFGSYDYVIGNDPFVPTRFAGGNYIDAMALVAKSTWATVGGYAHIQYGWEDYDFWCSCVERGLWGCHVPEILADYRYHPGSMVRTHTDSPMKKRSVIDQLQSRHAWLTIANRF